jgi:hypothetical protein
MNELHLLSQKTAAAGVAAKSGAAETDATVSAAGDDDEHDDEANEEKARGAIDSVVVAWSDRSAALRSAAAAVAVAVAVAAAVVARNASITRLVMRSVCVKDVRVCGR